MERIIRPLFVVRNLECGGAERALLTVLRHLDTTRFSPTLFLLKREGVYWREVPEHVRVVCALERGSIRDKPAKVLGRLIQEARAHDLVVAASEFTPTYFAWLAGLLARRPVIGWTQTDLREFLSRYGRWHQSAGRFLYPRLHTVVFASHGARESAARLFGQGGHKWHTIHNPLDWASYSEEPTLAEFQTDVIGQPTVIAMGRLHQGKGFDVLIRAHARLIREGVDHHLLILGEGPERRKMEELIDRLSVRKTVWLPGWVHNPLPYLRSATVLASASFFEGFSMVVLEALGVGLPVVSTDCPSGPSEILDRGRYGLLVPVNDEIALAAAIRQLLCDKTLRSRLSAAGPERARQFSPERIAIEWERLLASFCQHAIGRRTSVASEEPSS